MYDVIVLGIGGMGRRPRRSWPAAAAASSAWSSSRSATPAAARTATPASSAPPTANTRTTSRSAPGVRAVVRPGTAHRPAPAHRVRLPECRAAGRRTRRRRARVGRGPRPGRREPVGGGPATALPAVPLPRRLRRRRRARGRVPLRRGVRARPRRGRPRGPGRRSATTRRSWAGRRATAASRPHRGGMYSARPLGDHGRGVGDADAGGCGVATLRVMRQVPFWFAPADPRPFRRDRFPSTSPTRGTAFLRPAGHRPARPKVARHYGAAEFWPRGH